MTDENGSTLRTNAPGTPDATAVAPLIEAGYSEPSMEAPSQWRRGLPDGGSLCISLRDEGVGMVDMAAPAWLPFREGRDGAIIASLGYLPLAEAVAFAAALPEPPPRTFLRAMTFVSSPNGALAPRPPQ